MAEEPTKTIIDIFPLEIWELILDKIVDTNDVLNVLEVCPKLKSFSQGKQFSWQIGQVMPLILSKYMRYKEILASRLVSRKWNSAIAASLENHAENLPYNVTRAHVPTITEHNFMYHKGPKIRTNFHRLMNSEWAASVTSPCSINPFLGRSVQFNVDSTNGVVRGYRSPEIKLSEAISIFKKFGHHIWYITFDLCGRDSDKTHFLTVIMPSMFQCLSYLPNLKSLKITSYHLRTIFGGDDNVSVDESTVTPFPANLETLDLTALREVSQKFHDTLIKLWVNHDHVKRLAINVDKWNKAYGTLFPNLTELWIYLGSTVRDPELAEILKEMKCPHLRKLRLYFNQYDVNELLNAIEPYQIEVLEIGGNYFEDYLFQEGILLPSVRDCKVYATPYGRFTFLKAFPSLKYLAVEVSHVDDPAPFDYSDEEDEEEDKHIFCKCLRDFVDEDSRGPYNFDSVWDDLPTLEVLTVYMSQYVRGYPGKTFKSFQGVSVYDFSL